MASKSKTSKVIGNFFRFLYFSVIGFFKWLFVDSFRFVRDSYRHAVNPEMKEKLNRELEQGKKVDLCEKKIKRLERLTYAIYKDPSYSESDRGRDDIKEIKRGLKDELH